MKKYNGEKGVISLTSWKARIDTVHKTIENLLTMCPGFHVCLTLSLEEFPNGVFSLPRSLTDMEKANKFEIIWVKKNYKAFKKVLFAIMKYPQVPVISADDDCIYTENYAEKLYQSWVNCEKLHQIHGYEVDRGSWPCRFPCGQTTLYPPCCFSGWGINLLTDEIIATGQDDIYYGVLAFRLGIPFVDVSKRRVFQFHDTNGAIGATPQQLVTAREVCFREIDRQLEEFKKNEKELVSIIIPTRGPNQLDKVIKNYNEIYPNMNKEFIIVEQTDDDLFRKGALYNIGVSLSSGKYIALADNDIVHLRPVNWIREFETRKRAIVGFSHITQLSFDGDELKKEEPKLHPWSFGGFVFLSRKMYEMVNGYSNLYANWGFEDNDWAERIEYVRLMQDLGHITHPKRDIDPDGIARNKKIFDTRLERDNMLDGYLQTVADYKIVDVRDGITTVEVKNIRVTEDFKYKDLFPKLENDKECLQ